MNSLYLSMILNVGSIILGIGAWILACLAVAGKKVNISHRFSVASFVVCVISLIFQLFEISNRVNNGDFAAIEDTIRAVILASVTLVVVTIVLNVAALLKQSQCNRYR